MATILRCSRSDYWTVSQHPRCFLRKAHDWSQKYTTLSSSTIARGTQSIPLHEQYYTHEANAYMVLSELQGQWISRYYGSYTLPLSVDPVHTRTVRMILVEHIQGITMADAEPGKFPQSARQSLLKSIVYIESRIYEKDIFAHRPRAAKHYHKFARKRPAPLSFH